MIKYKNLDLPNKVMKKPQLCWAASIEMVSDKSNIQLELKKKINTYLNVTNRTTMPLNEKFYSQLFKEDILDKRGCQQIQSRNFASKDFIIKQINKNQPIIISGIHYPLFSDITTLHAFVIEGYKFDDDIFWILALDPRNTSKTFKVAWVYNELIKIDKDVRLRHNPSNNIDFISNFNFIGNIDTNGFPELSLDNQSEYIEVSNVAMTENLANRIRDSKWDFIKKFFGKQPNLLRFLGGSSNYISRYAAFLNSFTDDNTYKKTYYYPAWIDNEVVLEFIFFEAVENKLTLIAIQEPIGIQKLTQIVIQDQNNQIVTYKLNHKEPTNYTIEHIAPYNYIFLRIEVESLHNQTYYSPIDNYETLKQGYGYTLNEIENFFLTINHKENE